MGRVSNEEWRGRPVVREQEAASHGGDLQIISHSPCLGCVTSASAAVKACRAPPEPSISLLTCLPSPSSMPFFCVCVCPSLTLLSSCLVYLSPPHLNPDATHFFHLCPPCFASVEKRCLPKLSAVTRHGCPGAIPLICLSCAHTPTHTFPL